MNDNQIQRMIHLLARLPGMGPRSGRRVTLHLLKKKDSLLLPLIHALQDAANNVQTCKICYNLHTTNPCDICQNEQRNKQLICVIEDISDLWAMERTKIFNGQYHVLGGVLSAVNSIGPEQLTIQPLLQKVVSHGVTEVILALNATLEGQTTIHFLSQKLKSLGVKVSALAHGVPVGGELDYLDDSTLSIAYNSRCIV